MVTSHGRNLVATFNFGNLWYAELTIPFMRRYADKTGADFIEFKTFARAHHYPPPASWFHVEAMFIFARQDYFQCMMLLDADELILPGCPNLFVEPTNPIRVVQDMGYPLVEQRFVNWCQRQLNQSPRPGPYFNAGMMVVPLAAARRVVEWLGGPYPQSERMHTDDQDFLNLKVSAHEELDWLPNNYNWLAPQFEDASLQQDIVHFVGGHKSLLPSLIHRIERHG